MSALRASIRAARRGWLLATMKPSRSNACSGCAPCLQVKVTSDCNGSCVWCIERGGFTPQTQSPRAMVRAIATTDKEDVIFTGGEPTLSANLAPLIEATVALGKHAWIWTNGHSFGKSFVAGPHADDLFALGISGVTLSIHNFDLARNAAITGIDLDFGELRAGASRAKDLGVKIHLTCNLVRGEIDSLDKMRIYIDFSKRLRVDKLRFAELSGGPPAFVDMTEIIDGLPGDPFTQGCETHRVIDGMPTRLSLACGLNNPTRPTPVDPELSLNPVLFEDGVVHAGWLRGEGEESI